MLRKLTSIAILSSTIIIAASIDIFAFSPAYSVMPLTIDYGPVYKNGMQWERATVESYWINLLEINSVIITGDTEDFTIIPGDDSCSGKSLEYDQRCVIKVTFVPITEGPKNATLSVQSNGGINSINLKGIGVARTSTITATAPPLSGGIAPSGKTSVAYGGEQSFTITQKAGWHVHDVIVDNVSQGAVTSYTFRDVIADHSISVRFVEDIFTIKATAGKGGSISPSGDIKAHYEQGMGFSIKPDPNYQVADVLVDGVSVGSKTWHLFRGVTKDHTIRVTFTKITNQP